MLSRRWMPCSSARSRACSSVRSPWRCATGSRAACPPRWARRSPRSSAFLVVGAIALVTGVVRDPIDARDVLVFAAIGAGVPGLSQIAFVQAIRHAGAARTAVLIGVAPMLSFMLAAMFLGEGISAGLVAGAALIVIAGASLSFERTQAARATGRSARCSPCSARASSRCATRSSAGARATRRWTARAHGRLARGGRDRRRRLDLAHARAAARPFRCASR